MINIYGVISRLVKLVKDTYIAPALSCGSEDGQPELVFVDGLRATECEQYSAGLNILHSFEIEARIAL